MTSFSTDLGRPDAGRRATRGRRARLVAAVVLLGGALTGPLLTPTSAVFTDEETTAVVVRVAGPTPTASATSASADPSTSATAARAALATKARTPSAPASPPPPG